MSRIATGAEVETWRRHGWVLLEGLVGPEEIDAAVGDLGQMFPSAEDYHRDPAGVTEQWKGRPREEPESYQWPEEGPGFRGAQQRWMHAFPFPGSGLLNRLCVHPSIVDFAARALGSDELRLYQVQASAKYSGLTNYEQPMHTDRNHSWLPAGSSEPWWNLQGFLYLSDVTDDDNPTRLVSVRSSAGADRNWVAARYGVLMPNMEPDLYQEEQRAPGVRGSYLAYRSDVFHRGGPFGSAGTARFLLGLAFRQAGQDWIGYDARQSVSTSDEWVRFVEGSSPRELELFGFPPPGHPIWDDELIDATARRYPGLDLDPWRAAIRDQG